MKETMQAPATILSEIPAEKIRGDVLLLDTMLNVAVIPMPQIGKDTEKIYGEAPAPEDSATISRLRVFFFRSPIKYKGYKYFRDELQLFGLHPREVTGLHRIDGTLYLRKGQDVYALIEQNSFNNYISVQNPEILKLLRR